LNKNDVRIVFEHAEIRILDGILIPGALNIEVHAMCDQKDPTYFLTPVAERPTIIICHSKTPIVVQFVTQTSPFCFQFVTQRCLCFKIVTERSKILQF